MITSMVDAQNDCLFIDGKKVLDFIPYIAKVKLTTTSKGEKRAYRIQIRRNGEVIKEVWLSKLYYILFINSCEIGVNSNSNGDTLSSVGLCFYASGNCMHTNFSEKYIPPF